MQYHVASFNVYVNTFVETELKEMEKAFPIMSNLQIIFYFKSNTTDE